MNLNNTNTPIAPLDFHAFMKQIKQDNVLVIDTRHHTDFLKNHIPNSIFIGIDGPFEIWTKILLLKSNKQLLLITPNGRHKEVITKLSCYGILHIIGYLNESLDYWTEQCTSINSISANNFKNIPMKDNLVFDVRKDNEYLENNLKNTFHTPLNSIDDYLDQFPEKEPYYLFCGGGYRSVIAASILKSKGFLNPINIEGGFKAINEIKID